MGETEQYRQTASADAITAEDNGQAVNAPQPAPPDARKIRRRAVFTGLLFLLIYFIAQLLVTMPYAVAAAVRAFLSVGAENYAAFQEKLTELLAGGGELITALSDALALLAFLLTLRLMKRPVREALSLHRVPAGKLLLLVPLGLSLNLFCTSLISLLPSSVLDSYMDAAGQVLPTGFGALSVLLVALLAPVTEEVLFRGLVYGSFRGGLPRWLAVALTSALFGLMHGQPLWMAYTAAFSVLLCLLRERQGSLYGCIVLHASFNAGGFLVLALAAAPLAPLLAASGLLCGWLLICVFGKEGFAFTPPL